MLFIVVITSIVKNLPTAVTLSDFYNDYISKEPGHENRFCTYFPVHCVLGHNLTDTDSLDNVVSKKESSTTNSETNECRPTQIETETNNKYEENTPEEQEI